MLPTHVWWWSFFLESRTWVNTRPDNTWVMMIIFQRGKLLHMAHDDHFFAKRTQNLLMCPQNGNLRFLTHNRDLGAIPPPKWSYGRRASFWMGLAHSKYPPKIQKISLSLAFWDGCWKTGGVCLIKMGLNRVVVARYGLKLGGNEATRSRIIFKLFFWPKLLIENAFL